MQLGDTPGADRQWWNARPDGVHAAGWLFGQRGVQGCELGQVSEMGVLDCVGLGAMGTPPLPRG